MPPLYSEYLLAQYTIDIVLVFVFGDGSPREVTYFGLREGSRYVLLFDTPLRINLALVLLETKGFVYAV